MKSYQVLALAATMVFGAATPVFAAEAATEEKKPAAKQVVYRAGMTGVTWAGCVKSVRAAFTEKLPNVSSVEIKPGKKEGTQLVIVKSADKGITKDQAVKALGDKAERFVVKTWNEGGKGKKPGKDAAKKKAS